MPSIKRFTLIVGARPNFIKAAPLLKTAKQYPELHFSVIHTGQHYDAKMSQIFFEELQINKPEVILNTSSYQDSEKISKMIIEISKSVIRLKSEAVIVFGDVNSTLAGALAAKKTNLPLIHVEAGLRSYDKRMPEETNRFIVDHLSSLHFITESSARSNLKKEGISVNSIKLVGNLMIESLEQYKEQINNSSILETLKLRPKSYIVLTTHRDENINSHANLKKILSLIRKLSSKYTIIFPIHPHTKKTIGSEVLTSLSSVKVIDPLGYFEFIKLVSNSIGIVTDSGGIQEEASYLNVPCCTLRDNTERPITTILGTNKLFSLTSPLNAIVSHLNRKPILTKIPFWDAKVSFRIINELKAFVI